MYVPEHDCTINVNFAGGADILRDYPTRLTDRWKTDWEKIGKRIVEGERRQMNG